jgi:hypothetical protein
MLMISFPTATKIRKDSILFSITVNYDLRIET